MQHSADFIALGTYQSDVRAAEHEIGLRKRAEGRDDDDGTSSTAAPERRRSHRRAPRLALLR
ncbi:hypothetical protein [Agromyces bauzanensis]|uniref:Uncharacterized protein n=1 Tax=Agromyces bauzanensis TaxID=1308924 RepID=A0A917PJL4_9MICO|nr:hypothetical protein [Agromyces bauzanensis]GGJ80742.1 hypothetical protein GCM10011372_18970 [Agromyces bauzanensis]